MCAAYAPSSAKLHLFVYAGAPLSAKPAEERPGHTRPQEQPNQEER